MTRCAVSPVVLALVALAPACASASTYRDPARHFSFELPADWEQMSAEDLDRHNQTAMEWTGQSPNYVAGFYPKNRPTTSYGNVVVRDVPFKHSKPSFEQLERDLKKMVAPAERALEQLSPVEARVSAEFMGIDRDANRFVLRSNGEFADIGKVSGRTYGMVGNKRIVSLNCSASNEQFAEFLPVFEGIANSFRFDHGYGYADSQETQAAGSTGALIGVMGAAAVIGVVVVAKLGRRRTRLPSSDGPAQAT
jgi:hypothetical protein